MTYLIFSIAGRDMGRGYERALGGGLPHKHQHANDVLGRAGYQLGGDCGAARLVDEGPG